MIQFPATRKDYLPALASAGLALVLYAVTLRGTYIYDDLFIAQKDPRVSNPHLWGEYWTKDYFNGGVDNLYRPLVSMTYGIEYWLHGDRPWAFHLVNWLLHAAVCAAVTELARRMIGRRAAYLAGLLFAAHPIHVEVVTGIVGRAELMATLGIVGALILFIHRPMTVPRAIAIWGCFVLALLSKEQGMLLPLLLLMWEMIRRWIGAARTRDKGMSALIVMLTFTLAGYIVFRETILKFWWDRSWLDWTINPMLVAVGRDRWLVPLSLLGRYTALLVAPTQLCIEYGTSIASHETMHDPFLWLGAATIAAWIIALAIAMRYRKGVIIFCLLSLAILYALVGNFLTIIGTIFAERLMYLPSVFFLILIAAAMARLRRGAMMTLAIVVLAIFSLRTATYAWEWNDRLRLYESSLDRNPQSIRLHLMVAEERERRRDIEGASALAGARETLPSYWGVWVHSAIFAYQHDEFDDAEKFLKRAIDLNPLVHTMPIDRKLHERLAATQPATRKQ